MLNLNPSQLLPPMPGQTDLVTLTIKINGQPIPDVVSVKNMVVSHGANRIPYALITILDGDVASQSFASSDLDIFSPGNPIEIQAGYHGANNTLFKGIIVRHALKVGQQGASYIEVECKDVCVKLTVGRKNKYFLQKNDQQIIDEILGARGIQGSVESTSVVHQEMVQYYATDWDFILSRAEANGMLVFADNGQLTVKKPNFGQAPKFPLNFGSSIFEFEAEMDARDQYPTAKASTWDPAGQQVRVADPGGLGALPSAPGTGALGAGLPGVPPNTDYTQVMGLSDFPLQHPGHLGQEEAQHWAKSQMTKSALAKSRGYVRFDGTADIKPGESLNLQGVGQRHSGPVYVTAVTHEIGEGNWRTTAQFGLPARWQAQEFDDVTDEPASSLLPAVHGLQIGIVTKLENSPADSEFRVQVCLPLVDPQGQGVWTRLATQDAGNNRGAVWRPEIGDEVVVGFFNDDPRQAVVLGMLHSSANAAPIAAADKNDEKGWVTRSGIRFVFNDDKKSVILHTPKGKKVTIDENADLIQLEDEHQNKITMDKNGIIVTSSKDLKLSAKQGKVEVEAMNINIKAQTELSAESSTKTSVKSTGQLELKGATVMIN